MIGGNQSVMQEEKKTMKMEQAFESKESRQNNYIEISVGGRMIEKKYGWKEEAYRILHRRLFFRSFAS